MQSTKTIKPTYSNISKIGKFIRKDFESVENQMIPCEYYKFEGIYYCKLFPTWSTKGKLDKLMYSVE